MTQPLPYPLSSIIQAAELSRGAPDDAEALLRALERAAAIDLAERIGRWRETERAAQASWARLAAMVGPVGVRANPYRPSPMPEQEPRAAAFLRFTRRLAAIRSSLQPLRFHLLAPPVGAEDIARLLETATNASRDLQALAPPCDWPEAEQWRRDLQAEALDATERAARFAAALGRQQDAADLFALACNEAAGQGAFKRARHNRLHEARARLLAGDCAGDCLDSLDFDLALLTVRDLVADPAGWGRPVPPLTALNEVLVRAEINETLGRNDEALRLLREASKVLEPTPGEVVCPAREQFVTAMLEAMTLETQNKPYAGVLEHLQALSEGRALAQVYCNVAASAFQDTAPARAARYRATTIAIARM